MALDGNGGANLVNAAGQAAGAGAGDVAGAGNAGAGGGAAGGNAGAAGGGGGALGGNAGGGGGGAGNAGGGGGGNGNNNGVAANLAAAQGAQPGWTTPTFVAGIIVGMFLIVGSLVVQALNLVPSSTLNLVMCCGLGIILGAFGTVALVRLQGVVIAGCGALAVVLFLLLVQNSASFLKIIVAGVPDDMLATLMMDNTYTAQPDRFGTATFFVVERSVSIREARLQLASEQSEVEFCVPMSMIRDLGTGRTMQWRLVPNNQGLEVADGVENVTDCNPRVASVLTGLPDLSLVSPAVAQDPQVPIEVLLKDLDSPSASVRRDARDGLAQWGEEAIRPMMDLWASDPEHYRNTLGVSVALTEFLRDHKDQRAEISSLMTPADLELLVRAISHPDRTMRVYATEFLFDLGDQESAPLLLNSLSQASPDGQFNAGFVLNNVVDFMTPADRTVFKPALDATLPEIALGPASMEEFEKLAEKLGVDG